MVNLSDVREESCRALVLSDLARWMPVSSSWTGQMKLEIMTDTTI